MNYKAMVRGALALSLGLMVGVASAADTQKYGATFESATNNVAGSMNDYAYTNNMPITDSLLHNDATATGWFTGDAEGDESKIITRTDSAGGQALQLNTDASTLTNKFSSSVAGDLNAALTAQGVTYYETEVKFVASDTLDAGIQGGTDDAKFAIYAYSDEDAGGITTNLVIYHAYVNGAGNIDYTNEVFATPLIDCDVYTKLRIEVKKLDAGEDGIMNVFSVSVDNGEALSSDTAFDAYLNGTASGTWFLTVENSDLNSDNAKVSALTFKGTGEIDNISVGVVTEDVSTYNITASVTGGTIATNGAAADAGTYALVEGDTVVFTADTGYTLASVTTNSIAVADVDTTATSYTFTVADSDVTIAVVFEASASDDYAADDDVGGTTLSAAMATWLNGLKDAKGMTKDAYTAAIAADTDALSLTEEYLLNTDPTVNTTVEFKISSIAVGDTVDVQVTLTRTESAAVTSAINGTLKIYGAATVNGSYTPDQSLTDKFNGVTTATKSFSTENKFFKAVIE